MKKTVKAIFAIVLMLVMVVTLTGCGDKDNKDSEKEDSNKIVATKNDEIDGITYEQKLEISLKEDKIDEVKMTMTFDDEETAETYKKQLDGIMAMAEAFGGEKINFDTKVSGKKLIINLDAESFDTMVDVDISSEKVDKDELKKALEDDGYKVK